MPSAPYITPPASPEEELYLDALHWYWGMGGHPVDDRVAAAKFEEAAQLGHPPAMLQMGVFRKCGGLFRKDGAAAAAWFRRVRLQLGWFQARAEARDVLAMWQLSRILAHGLVSDPDHAIVPSEALRAKVYPSAAAGRDLPSPPPAPRHWDPSVCDGEAEAGRFEEDALEWCRLAAADGYALAQFDLSQCYHAGEGVARDARLAAEWCRRAADQSMVEAAYWLGHYFRDGAGVEPCSVEAVKWLRAAAALGHCAAQRLLGFVYTPARDRAACKWLRNARDNGSLPAEHLLNSVLASQQRASKRKQLLAVMAASSPNQSAPTTPSTPQLLATAAASPQTQPPPQSLGAYAG